MRKNHQPHTCSFGCRFPLKIMNGGSISPFAVTVNATVICRFSAPVVLMMQDFTPTLSTTLFGTRSKYTGVLSMFPMNAMG